MVWAKALAGASRASICVRTLFSTDSNSAWPTALNSMSYWANVCAIASNPGRVYNTEPGGTRTMRHTLPTLLLLLAGCAPQASSPQGKPPQTPEEKVVARFLKETANDPASLEFASWEGHTGQGL